jgi:hypothetical protein
LHANLMWVYNESRFKLLAFKYFNKKGDDPTIIWK